MRTYKLTAGDAVGVFTRFPWPVPGGGNPGAWVDASETAQVCERGVHACRVGDLPYLLAGTGALGGGAGRRRPRGALQARRPRGRLLRRVEGWPELERPFAEDCAARVQDLAASELRRAGLADLAAAATAATTAELAAVAERARAEAPPLAATLAGYALDCVWDVGKGYYAMCAYVAATAFGNWSTGDVVQDMTSTPGSRSGPAQARWLVERLALPEGV